MAPVNTSTTGSAAVFVADPDVLGRTASRIGDLADRLSSTGPLEPALLPAVVPQAARLAAALSQARRRQADTLSGFVGFYRASAVSLDETATHVDRADGDATASFRALGTGRLA